MVVTHTHTHTHTHSAESLASPHCIQYRGALCRDARQRTPQTEATPCLVTTSSTLRRIMKAVPSLARPCFLTVDPAETPRGGGALRRPARALTRGCGRARCPRYRPENDLERARAAPGGLGPGPALFSSLSGAVWGTVTHRSFSGRWQWVQSASLASLSTSAHACASSYDRKWQNRNSTPRQVCHVTSE